MELQTQFRFVKGRGKGFGVQTTSVMDLDLRPSGFDMEALLERFLPSPERRAVIEAMSESHLLRGGVANTSIDPLGRIDGVALRQALAAFGENTCALVLASLEQIHGLA